uniref:Amino acid transporter n=1 Tax=Globodera rostochiensis TaxID=31243 RepID=A0A914IAH9_GLORO
MRKDLLLVLTVESVVIGVVLGFMIRPLKPSNDAISLIGFPGEIFMQIVEMMILPLIISSVISALSQIRPKVAGRIGLLTVAYYMTTTFLSTFTGILLVSSIHPGDPQVIHQLGEGTLDDTALSPLDTFLDQIRNMFPENIVQATFQQVQTNYVPVKPPRVPAQRASLHGNSSYGNNFAGNVSLRWVLSGTNHTPPVTTTHEPLMKPILEYTNEVNVLGLIVFCTGFGVILSILGEQARLMINFFIVLDAVIMRWISALMWCYPIGILSLALAMYVVTVICGLMIHSLLTLPLLYYAITRQSPFEFMTGMLQAVATAFGTASSGATLPVTFRALEQNLRIDRRVTRFVLPLGATITMDGTALYEAVAVIFIAQLHNIKLTALELLTISITTTVASIGSGSVPAVDWLLDRIRTSVNVLGDGFGCGIISHMTKDRLIESDNVDLIRQLKTDIELLNAPTTPGSALLTPVPSKRTRGGTAPAAKLNQNQQLQIPKPKSSTVFTFPSPLPPQMQNPQLQYPPQRKERKNSTVSAVSAQAEERRSLLEGSMEFTV